jgi:glycerol-3-phosphate dehydrogenase
VSAAAWREALWPKLETTPWQLVIVGGGITGAGLFFEAARRGLRVLLLEQGDFGSGTSSRSSKLVHGGLRYLAQGDLRLTWESVRERDRLLGELPGLVEPLGFLLASYRGDRLGLRTLRAGLRLYDFFSRGAHHLPLSATDLVMLAPRLRLDRLAGGFWYRDAQTDDARLVLRTLFEGLAAGGEALSQARVEELLRTDGAVRGVVVRDRETGRVARVEAETVVNATGAWADALRAQVGGRPAIRPLRGSHLLFPPWRFPVAQAVALRHPEDGRPLFAYPWEGLTLLGTTDVDHGHPMEEEPVISANEAAYLVTAARAAFPGLGLRVSDAVSSYSGVRPVVGTGKADASQEPRDHALWEEQGLLTITGGKLTTFRHLARQALAVLAKRFPQLGRWGRGASHYAPLEPLPSRASLDPGVERRLAGRYGRQAARLLETAHARELQRIPGTWFHWAELRWAARTERVVHLDDLLLRRVRAGLVLPEGGREHLPRVRALCQAELRWDDRRWEEEVGRYLEGWQRHHGVPEKAPPQRASAPEPGVGPKT